MANRANRNHEDRISALPDNLIHHILCFLTTLEAVRTSLLSTRWRDLWKSLPHLDFADYDFYLEGDNGRSNEETAMRRSQMKKFARFVEMVLARRDTSSLESFRLFWNHRVDITRAERWVEYAVELRAKVVDVATSHFWPAMERPEALFKSPFIEVLRMAFLSVPSPTARLVVPTDACLRRLHTLHLTAIPRDINDAEQVESMQRLLAACPLLQNLLLDWCNYQLYTVTRDDVQRADLRWNGCTAMESIHRNLCPQRILRFSAPCLRWLDIRGCPCGNVTFSFDAPNLVAWSYQDCCFKAVPGDLMRLESASVSLMVVFPAILWKLRCAAVLCISCYMLKLLDHPPLPRGFPTFYHLTKLTLRAVLDFHDLIYLLHHIPFLQLLSLENMTPYNNHRTKDFKEQHWRLMPARHGFMACLNTFSLHKFSNSGSEREFVKFMMTTARVLTSLVVSPEKNHLIKLP